MNIEEKGWLGDKSLSRLRRWNFARCTVQISGVRYIMGYKAVGQPFGMLGVKWSHG